VDPITDQEVELLQKKKDQAEVANFDLYVNSLINPRKPGDLQWLMSVYPEFFSAESSRCIRITSLRCGIK
jgi:hypothetical protein